MSLDIPPELLGAAVAGLVTWGGVGMQLRWHRSDIDRAQRDATAAHERIDRLPCAAGRRASDCKE